MSKELILSQKQIENKIFNIGGVQVMIDSDLAEMYQTETKFINRAMKRNPERFPETYVFQLTAEEWESLRFQSGTSNGKGGRRYFPLAFTEYGVAMLSAVLHTTIAIPTQGVFFDGQVFDAYELASKIIRSASQRIVLIDNYLNETTLTQLSKKKKGVKVLLLTKIISKALDLDVQKASEQYGDFTIKSFSRSHDRFIIIDNREVYHIGASLKDLGKKWFAFSRMDKKSVSNILNSILEMI